MATLMANVGLEKLGTFCMEVEAGAANDGEEKGGEATEEKTTEEGDDKDGEKGEEEEEEEEDNDEEEEEEEERRGMEDEGESFSSSKRWSICRLISSKVGRAEGSREMQASSRGCSW
jgi:hypothetical protein